MPFVCVSCQREKVSLAKLALGLTMAVILHGVMTGARLPSLNRTASSKYCVSHSFTARQSSSNKSFTCFMCNFAVFH